MPKVMPIPEVGGRGRRGRRVSTTLSEINVIPLVDVMLVLLIIFMVAAPMLQRGVEVNLPVARQTQKLSEVRLYVTVPLSFRKDRRVYLDDEAVPIDVLAERMRQAMMNRDEHEVFLRGD
ncbi:MAG: biopolymer transporter ExbD, partial [Acidobacteriota bacterium]